MRDLEHARMLLGLARRDLRALEGMRSAEVFADEIFGFHAQQVVEKALKAWLSLAGTEYPKTHDLKLLLTLLQDSGCDITPLWDLVEYNAFAVQYRYEAFEAGEDPLDRDAVVGQVRALISQVAEMLQPSRDFSSGEIR
jgi:HEPN domain-containing protein